MAYLVFFLCPSHVVDTGAATFKIERGGYVYVGSCGVSCVKRVTRHLRRPAVRRWHVDYLNCEGLYAVVVPAEEREAARRLAERCPYVPGFGATDDPEAPSHLFRCSLAEALYWLDHIRR